MDTAPPQGSQRQPCRSMTGASRLALWQAAQKKLQGKLHLREVAKMREEWDQPHLARR